jgi:hypothetical protein
MRRTSGKGLLGCAHPPSRSPAFFHCSGNTRRIDVRFQRSTDAALALALFVTGLLMQLAVLNRGAFYTDEGLVLQTAAEINRGKIIYRDIIMPLPGPAAFYLLAGLFRMTGESFPASRVLMAVMSSGLAAVLYLLARGVTSRWVAALVGLAFLSLRLWGFPHWLFYHYASCAGVFLALAFTLLSRALNPTRVSLLVLAGTAGGISFLAKQDVGGAGLVGLAAAALLLGGTRRLISMTALAGGALAVVGPTLIFFAANGALYSLLDQAVFTAFRGYDEFPYLQLPNVFPLLSQDAALRQHIGEYAPSILVTLYWPQITASSVFRDTALLDVAIKIVFFLPYVTLLLAVLVYRPWRTLHPVGHTADHTYAHTCTAVILIYAAVVLAAFNPPRDWLHLLVLYHPTLLLWGLLIHWGVEHLGPRSRRLALTTLTIALLAATVLTVRMTRDLRRLYDTPVATSTGTVWLKSEEAVVLENLLGHVGDTTTPTDPLPVIPYHPLIQFFADRTAGLSNYFLWPVRPSEDTDTRLIADVEAAQPPTIIYSVSQYAHLRRFGRNFPELFAHLVDHYDIVRTFSPPSPWGAVFCALGRSSPLPPALVSLTSLLPQATVSIQDDVGSRVLSDDDRIAVAGRALWPFRRVIYQRAPAEGSSTIAFKLVPPEGAQLRFAYGLNPDEWVSFAPAGVRFTVTAAPVGTEQRTLFSASIDPQRHTPDRMWHSGNVDLSHLGGQQVMLMLRVAVEGPSSPVGTVAGWAEPELWRPSTVASTGVRWARRSAARLTRRPALNR